MAQRREALSVDDVVHRKDGMLSSKTPVEMLAFDADTGACFAFDGPSARIWELLEAPIRIGDLVGRLTGEYAIDEARCRDETLAHLGKLRDEGVLVVAPPTAP